jgi:hypothetical protein
MAARKKLVHDTNTREKIRVSQLINRLQNHIDDKCELSATQLKAVEILLKKSLPDLSATHNTEDQSKSFETWLDEIDSGD